jgi:hypothetical protein
MPINVPFRLHTLVDLELESLDDVAGQSPRQDEDRIGTQIERRRPGIMREPSRA